MDGYAYPWHRCSNESRPLTGLPSLLQPIPHLLDVTLCHSIGVRGEMLMAVNRCVFRMVNDIPTMNKYGESEIEIIHTMRPGPFGLRKVQHSH